MSKAISAAEPVGFVAFCFLVEVYRPDRDSQLTALLCELGLLSYVGSLGCFTTAWNAIPYEKNQILPKWLPTWLFGRSSPR